MVYRRTRKDEDYANYKEALNLATTEIKNIKYKRTIGKKLAGNIKNDSKSFYAYVVVNRTFEIRSDYWKTTVET